MENRERLNIVIVGHVDHGKSTVLGRLLADTNSLPEGKLEQVKANCARNAKPFEYAFLLDALKDEQSQGITIDIARCFFKTAKRDYIVLDAPGHIEFLKNMVTGVSRAEAAYIVVDAKEGIQENSRRHGYLVSMLGVKQVSVLINKMDLINYDENIFDSIVKEYQFFLNRLHVTPLSYIPVSARNGENIAERSNNISWYKGPTMLEQLETFARGIDFSRLPFRFPVQDIYKFTESQDDRRIVAGTIETGRIETGEEVVFLPSNKRSKINSIEKFNAPVQTSACAGEAIGFTLNTQIYIKPGELMMKAKDPLCQIGNQLKVNLFWLGRSPLIKNKSYKLKLGSARISVQLTKVINVIDASALESFANKQHIDRHDVAECILETTKPIAYDPAHEIESTGRFVLVDNYEIAGGGIVLETIKDTDSAFNEHIKEREIAWTKSEITPDERSQVYQHQAKFIVITGEQKNLKKELAVLLERNLFLDGFKAYYLGINNIISGLDNDLFNANSDNDEFIRRLGELARIFTDSGQILITNLDNVDDYDLERLKLLTAPYDFLVINYGENIFNSYPIDLLLTSQEPAFSAAHKIKQLLSAKEIIP